MIKEWVQEYKPQNKGEAESALREIMQEVALAGLQRTGFFEKAAFYGGTALRLFYGLDRFSENLDFVCQACMSAIGWKSRRRFTVGSLSQLQGCPSRGGI
jgi:hypothetical protein